MAPRRSSASGRRIGSAGSEIPSPGTGERAESAKADSTSKSAAERKRSDGGSAKATAGQRKLSFKAAKISADEVAAQPAAAQPAILTRAQALQGLQEAYDVLMRTDQGSGAPLEECARAVADDGFIRHPAKDVRLWAAKCCAEVLKIFVPKPPLDAQRLLAVLQLFVEELELLAEPSGNSYKHAFGLLERLTEIRGFMLIFDLEEAEDLLCKLVSTCLSAAKAAGTEAAGNDVVLNRLETQLAQLLIGVLSEAEEIPKPVLSSLIETLMPRQLTSAAAGLVRRVFTGLANHSAVMPINDFLNTTLYSEDTMPEGEQAGGQDRQAVQDRLEALLCAVYQLYAIEPALVQRVLPNLQNDLHGVDPDRRRMVTALVGQMLAHAPTGDDAPASHKTLALVNPIMVDYFLGRLEDADDGVRLTALEGTSSILKTAASLSAGGALHDAGHTALVSAAEAIPAYLLARCIDPNDLVRSRAVQLAGEIASESNKGLELLLPVLPEMFRRVLDKKPRVREVSAEAVANLYAQHALPAWSDGKYQEAQALSWIPALLCEACTVYSGNRLGNVAELEEYIEQHVLGCGARLEANKRALLLLGFHDSASQGEDAARGLAKLLGKKRDANAAMLRFLKKRMAKAAPLAEMAAAGAGTLVPSQGADEPVDQASELLESLAKLSPAAEEKSGRYEATLVHLRSLDAVRDQGLWNQLDRLMNPCITSSVGEITEALLELDRLLRVHRLRELAPLIRRALISTWLLPEQVRVFLDLWNGSWPEGSEFGPEAPAPELRNAAQQLLADLPRYFPGAFLPHTQELTTHLKGVESNEARAALRALAAISKRLPLILEGADWKSSIDPANLADDLLEAIGAAGTDVTTRGSACRKAAKVLLFLPVEQRAPVTKKLLDWAQENISADEAWDKKNAHLTASALHLAAALVAMQRSKTSSQETWLALAPAFLCTGSKATSAVQCAAAELVAAAGGEDEIVDILLALAPTPDVPPLELPAEPTDNGEEGEPVAEPFFDSLPVHAVCATFRMLRSGALPVTTQIMTRLAARMCACLTPGQPVSEAEKLLRWVQRLSSSKVAGIIDRIRLCSTFPVVFALTTFKRHRDAMQGLLERTLREVIRNASRQRQPLLDVSVACFLHFLSRLEVFKSEASAAASAFPESSKVSAFFCEAVLRIGPTNSEHAAVMLRVCDRVRFFVDREEPTSDAVHRAASVLRYVVEKRFPELGVGGAALHGPRGSLPSELFATREANAKASLALAAPSEVESSSSLVQATGADLSPTRSLVRAEAPEVEAVSPLATEQASPRGPLTTPRRHSLLKRPMSASPAAIQDSMHPTSVARPMARAHTGASPNLTGAAVKAALSAQASAKNSKRRRSSAGGSQATQAQVA
mmetsp:Transcript_23020/g.41567  ORF Transcript_23020/g.41567 Transcript_23020/m.41567 type:complete len:1383 (-) Transcript_23020:174-4322(-)|eukprot:CAMPEP_0197654434 /NCGR_PEP_ID=MMETSP1338-20131121/38846_1 /TAXON_ID=43686 ORGANISM="Pelagodinium beii, Strain RCC1491" /NCGR_SAMPLE_ID=MMETSP1338 /ASSEMBLY_ACC=CAM_ASM_000754 /LENGTH=1382 /DNA_ID=CAMNT_0043229877 /DNA_START=68 /DNA_END=4216 /DNA_ORIENTATION=+